MDQLSALTVLGLVFAAANIISMKTRARVSMMFICSSEWPESPVPSSL